MRNVDKIKRLEHELGRYKKMVGDRDRLIAKLHRRESAIDEARRALNAAVINLATKGGYTEEVDGKVYHNCLRVNRPNVEELLAKYKLEILDVTEDEYVMQAVELERADG